MRREIKVEDFLVNLPLFKGLGEAELSRLAAGTTRRKLARGELLFRVKEPSTGIHAVVYGGIQLIAGSMAGRERIIDVVGPNRSFGEAVMFLGKPYVVSAVALTESLLLHVSRETIFQELARNPDFAPRVIGMLAERVEWLVHEVQDRAQGSGAKRFVSWLLRRCDETRDRSTCVITLPIAKRILASRLGLSAEHLSRILHDLAARGLIAVQGRQVSVPDIGRLRLWQVGDDRLLSGHQALGILRERSSPSTVPPRHPATEKPERR